MNSNFQRVVSRLGRFAFAFYWAAAALSATAQKTDGVLASSLSNGGEKRYALVIGNASYKYLPRLNNPTNDAQDMCSALKKLGFDTMCFENQRTKREMKDAVIRFTQKLAINKGVALVFYAGHGMQVKGENYLVPSEAELRSEADIDDESLNVNYLMAQLDNAKNPFNVVILDACRNDPISRGWRSVSRGLAQIEAPVGSVIIFSTAPGTVAFDGVGRNGLFTKHLLKNLTAPGLSLEEMIKQVSRGVTEESRKEGINQTPWWNSSFTGSFCFAGCIDATRVEELVRIREQKERLERELEQAQKESAARQAVLAAQQAKSRERQTELEKQVKQLEETKSESAGTKSLAVEELTATKAQLELVRNERQRQEGVQRLQSEQMQQLQARQKELDQKTAEFEAMARKVDLLERERNETQRVIADERARNKPLGEPQSVPVKKERTVHIVPTL
ncbi:MAG: caspase family protein [Pseudomonadota bacterium]